MQIDLHIRLAYIETGTFSRVAVLIRAIIFYIILFLFYFFILFIIFVAIEMI